MDPTFVHNSAGSTRTINTSRVGGVAAPVGRGPLAAVGRVPAAKRSR